MSLGRNRRKYGWECGNLNKYNAQLCTTYTYYYKLLLSEVKELKLYEVAYNFCSNKAKFAMIFVIL